MALSFDYAGTITTLSALFIRAMIRKRISEKILIGGAMTKVPGFNGLRF